MEIAKEILNQLGSGQFVRMTGAKDFIAKENGVVFSLPSRFAVNKANKVEILLDWTDTYIIRFYNQRGVNLKEISTHENVYCDQLRSVFSEETGLTLVMPTVFRRKVV